MTIINTVQIYNEVNNMILDMKNNCNESEYLQSKYKYLFESSNTLFNFVFNQYNSVTNPFQEDEFKKQLTKMLDYVIQVQTNKLNQNDASEKVGKMLANHYIPYYQQNPTE